MSAKQLPKSALLSLQDRVANIYYAHGLFCSMHPVPVLCFALAIILLCCYPFVHFSLPGNVPQEHFTPVSLYSMPEAVVVNPVSSESLDGSRPDEPVSPHWYRGPPVGYVQQILVRSVVSPWSDDLIFTDTFRGPLSKIFDIVEIVQNYQLATKNSSVMLDDICVHVSEAKAKHAQDRLPMYGCLFVSPANVWQKSMQQFLDDADIIGSVLSLGKANPERPSSALADVLFGVPWTETSIKKNYVWNRPRVLNYAVTVILRKYDTEFIEGLEARLHQSFPFLHANESISSGNIAHVYFHGQYSLVEFIPLTVTYVILFLYIYFSVRKIEMVKSKIGMAFSAVITVLASLCMSVGLCTWFGLSFTIRTGQVYLKDIFPYLVVIVGLENILVLTKSVVSTPVNLDVKVRLAQGLSKEGWSITKNLVTELAILTFGFFTFVPAIQEFCLFAVVGLLSDFFLQLVFFATVLAVDIGRMEMFDLQRQSLRQGSSPYEEELTHMYPLFSWPQVSRWHRGEAKTSSSAGYAGQSPSTKVSQYPANVVAPSYPSSNKAPLVKVPKRLRVAYFWARCRIFQRAFMVGFLVWVAFIIYKSGIISLLTLENSAAAATVQKLNHTAVLDMPAVLQNDENRSMPTLLSLPPSVGAVHAVNGTPAFLARSSSASFMAGESHPINVSTVLKHREADMWRHLHSNHWTTLFGYFNVSLTGSYISILPSIKLSIPVLPEEALRVRHPSDHLASRARWSPESAAKSGERSRVEDLKDDGEESSSMSHETQHGYYPSTPAELMLTAILAIPSVVFLIYVMMVLYQCICTRNYAEWRSSWSGDNPKSQSDIFTQLIIEAMPVVLEGHPQEVECLATDGNFVVSTCLAGEIRVWDSMSGECLNVINRRRVTTTSRQISRSNRDTELDAGDDQPSDYESGSPPSRSDSFLGPVPKRVASSSSMVDCNERSQSFTMTGRRRHGNNNHSNGGHAMLSSSDDLERESAGNKTKRMDLFKLQPNLAPTISTDFTDTPPKALPADDGFDFSLFQIYYDEHRQLMAEEDCSQEAYKQRLARMSSGEMSPVVTPRPDTAVGEQSMVAEEVEECLATPLPAVWCVDCRDSVIVAGCSDGKIEFWDTLSGALKYTHEETSHQGVTGIRIYNNRVIAIRLNGSVDFLEMVPVQNMEDLSSQFTFRMHRRSNYQVGAGPSMSSSAENGNGCTLWEEEELTCRWLHTARAHQQPITVLEVEGGKAVTGSQDHTLKVFRVEDTTCLWTLHGHYGPITTLFIDKLSPMTAASGSQDGAVCLWDLQTGTCICRLRGHDGAITSVSYTASYVLSAGTDNRLLVWERFHGHLLNTISLSQNYCNSIIMLTDNLLLTGRQGSLGIWDIRLGDPVRIVRLGNSDDSLLVRQVRHVGHTIVCDYGCQLRVVRFPAIVGKVD